MAKRLPTFDGQQVRIGNVQYPIRAIRSMGVHYVVTKKRMNFRSVGSDHDVTVKFLIDGLPNALVLKGGTRWWYSFYGTWGEPEAREFLAFAEAVRRNTFPGRLATLIDSLRRDGCFFYDSKRFTASGEIEAKNWRASLRSDGPILRNYNFLTVKQRGRWPWLSSRYISLEMDKDVFFYVLQNEFGVSFAAP